MDILIGAIVETVFGLLAEATGLSDWLRQRLGREPEKLAFQYALTQALADSANLFPGRDLRYFAETLRDLGGPLLARALQPAATFPNTDELTQIWLNHLMVASQSHYSAEFEQFAAHFIHRLSYHIENQQPLHWIIQARRQRSSEEAMRRLAEAVELNAVDLASLRDAIQQLMVNLQRQIKVGVNLTVETSGGTYISGNVNAQNFAGRDFNITHNNYYGNLPSTTYSERDSRVALKCLSEGMEKLSNRLTTEVERRLEEMRNAWREGRKADASKWLSELRNDSTSWLALSDEIQANILCFEARLFLDSGDIRQSKQLVNEAATLASTDSVTRARALIIFHESGPTHALELLSEYDDIDGVNLRSALILEQGEPERCIALLNDPKIMSLSNAETFRVRALAYLMSKHLPQAQLEIQKSIELAPRWESIREALALINYYSSISSATITERPALLPEPIAPLFIKSDNESRSRLRQAAQFFHELANDPEKSITAKTRLRIWEMACLANDPEQQQAAEVYCTQLLREHPTEYTVIAWATARGYEVDLQVSLVALEKRHKESSANLQIVLGLVLCYFRTKQYQEAIQLLEDSRMLFEEHQAISIWAHWYMQSQLVGNQQDTSDLVVENLKNGPYQSEIEDILLVRLAQRTNDWAPIENHFKQVYEETSDPHALLSYCEAFSKQLKWAELAAMADTLIEEVGTGNVLEFAVQGIYHAKRYAYCIELLDKHSNMFPDGHLPRQLQYLRLDCQHALGILPSAIIEAEKIFREDSSTRHLIKLLSLYYESGDLKRMAVEARLLIDRTDVLAEHLLQVAQLVQYEDRELAVSLWKQAYHNNLSDTCVGLAVSLSFNLKLENSPEHRNLMKQMVMLSQRAETGIIKKEMKDLVSFFKDLGQRNAELQEKYRTGHLPIHLVSSLLNWSLVQLYHNREENALIGELGQQFPLFVRYGGKQLLAGFHPTAPKWRLNLDITAVLLAEHLAILRKAEAIYAPLRIPPDLLPVLTQMRNALLHHQPSRLEAINNVLDYVDRKKILIADISPLNDDADELLSKELGADQVALCKEAISNNGYVVDFLPLTKLDFSEEQVILPEAISNHLVNIRALIQILWEEDNFDDDEYAYVLYRLGTEGEKVASVTQPVAGSRLYCNEAIVELLAGANLLPMLMKHFQVVLTSSTISTMRAVLHLNKQNKQTIEWLDNLRNRISIGINKGIYEIIPSSPATQDIDQKGIPTSGAERCFLALLSFDITENDVLWIDDRFISAYLHRDGAPIIGINEILKGLVTSGELQEKKYYDKLIALRVANVHFIPLHKDEILHHLKNVRVTDGKLIETNTLKILRRHVATSLLYGNLLQRPPLTDKAPNAMGEVAYMTELSRAIVDALKTIWAEFHQNKIECIARAEWILSSLYLNLSTARCLVWTNAEQNDLFLTAMSFSHLLECGFELSDLAGSRTLPKDYYDWLDQRLLRRNCENNPLLAASIASILKDLFKSIQQELLEKFSSKQLEYEIAKGLQKYYKPLPEVIQREMRQDADFMSSLGLVHLEVVDLDGIIFSASDFYQAALNVVNGQSTTIKALEPSLEVAFHSIDGESPQHRFAYLHPQTNRKHFIEHENLAMLSDSPIWRETVLRRNRDWFDCNAADFEQQIALIASAEDAIGRVEKVKEWRESSAAEFYQQLDFKIRKQEEVSVDDLMPPSLNGLARHLRLSTNADIDQRFKDALEQAASDLVTTEGLANAILRLSGIPVALPQTIILVANRLSLEDRRKLVKTLLSRVHSLIGKIHLVHLLLCISDQSPSFIRLSRWVTIRLLSETAKPEIEAFSMILLWANDAFNSRLHFRELPASIRLALVWTHAHHLMNIFATSGVPMEWLYKIFAHFKNIKILPELFERESEYWYDVAHPYRINMLRLLLLGLSYSFNSHEEQLTDHIKLTTASLAFVNVEEQQIPAIVLFQNLSLAHNSLGSFLGTDCAEALETFWGKAMSSMFSHTSLEAEQMQIIEECLNQSSKGDPLSMWTWLGATTGDLPLSQELQEQIKVAISRTNFAQYFKIDALKASLALRTASLRLRYVDDNVVHSHVRDQLINAAQILANLHTPSYARPTTKSLNESEERIYLFLVECALNIAHANLDNKNVAEEFSALLAQLLSILPPCPDVTKPLLQRLYEDTPIPVSRQFSRLYVWLRTN